MEEELIQICEEIFQNVISQLTLHMRFMDIALNRYTFVADSMEFRCDGKFFHYHPISVIKTFQNNPKLLTRGYFHVILHSIFQHEFFSQNKKMAIWNLACDMAVENVILELNLDCMSSSKDTELKKELKKIKEITDSLTAQKLYYYLLDLDKDAIKLLSPLFQFDQHECWYEIRNVINKSETLFGEETKDDVTGSGNNKFDKASHDSGEVEEGKEDKFAKEVEIQQIKNALQDWQDISEKIETDLETFSKNQEHIESLVQSLEKIHREKYNYSQFLKKFMRIGEKLQINDDEFDHIFYTYGLQLYKNLPLIEPLEYKEINNVRELVIAIDTSGSVQGRIVQAFLQKTYNIFQQKENFFSHFHIHILQCDMKIQEIKIIRSSQEFDEYIDNLEIKGLGGTDFRPVFQYVNEQLEKKVFKKLAGLLYFTDGDGVYPKIKPSFSTAFLFLEGNKEVNVPPWAIKYVLEGDEFYAHSTSEETN
ncbi:MAG: VWA-like domain-containing protein [Bacillota bacterium]|nr:VWA-like domain-containing protein [Bacillota bacterium]